MFHPVGNQHPSVYWRRRLLLFAALALLVVLLALTVRAMSSNAAGKPAAAGPQHSAPAGPAATSHSSSGSTAASSAGRSNHRQHQHATESKQSSSVANSASSSASSSAPDAASSGASTSAAPPARCQAKDLDIRAVVARPSYQVGQRPEVELQVTNTGTQPCVQDLADKQVVLKIYNGESRVWGSHDCQIEPGTDDRVLAVGSPVRVSITWSGLTSQPNCAGTRQRVGAGTYTLYASLSGHTGKAAQFTIS
ncbi:MAG TPA: hypothetical protein VFH38_03525 [Jatrophihabitans sp.]|nr:hypothetical protein [Jatrophihabitans sp.]